MDGQIDFFDLIEKQYETEIKSCLTCENCRPTQMYKHFCNPTRQVITEHTGSWLCRNKLYERRTK